MSGEIMLYRAWLCTAHAFWQAGSLSAPLLVCASSSHPAQYKTICGSIPSRNAAGSMAVVEETRVFHLARLRSKQDHIQTSSVPHQETENGVSHVQSNASSLFLQCKKILIGCAMKSCQFDWKAASHIINMLLYYQFQPCIKRLHLSNEGSAEKQTVEQPEALVMTGRRTWHGM